MSNCTLSGHNWAISRHICAFGGLNLAISGLINHNWAVYGLN